MLTAEQAASPTRGAMVPSFALVPWGTCLTFKMTFYDTKVVVNTCILGIHFATQ